MMDLNDRFVGLMMGMVILLLFFGYIAFFTKVEDKK